MVKTWGEAKWLNLKLRKMNLLISKRNVAVKSSDSDMVSKALEEKLFSFLRQYGDAENLDDNNNFEGEKADYLVLNKALVLEIKNIESNPRHKVTSFIDELSEHPSYPMFYGARSLNQIFEHFEDPEELDQTVYRKISQQIEAVLKKANRQIQNTQKMLALEDAAGVVILCNDNVEILDPEIIATRAGQFLHKKRGSVYR
ncbi:MAG: hypothetical protein AB3N28_09190, partial [Kordiimonas sp.]